MKTGLAMLLAILLLGVLSLRPAGEAQSLSELISRAIDYYYVGEYQKALSLLDRASKSAPNNATIHLWIGVVYAEAGLDSAKAIAALRRAKQLAAPNSPEAAQAQRWLLRLQGRPKLVLINFFATDPRYDPITDAIVEGMTRQMAAEGTYAYEVIKVSGGGRIEALLDLARRKEAGWLLRGILRQASVGPSLFEQGKYFATLRMEVTLVDGVLGNTVATFDAGEGSSDPSPDRAFSISVSRTSSGIWPKISNHIREADTRVREELNRVSIRLPVTGVYAYTTRMDRKAANTLPVAIVPAFRSSAGAEQDTRGDAADLFARALIVTGRFAVVPESELFKTTRTRGDAVDEQTLARAAQRLRAKYTLIADITSLTVKSQFALIGTSLEAEAGIRIRVLSAEGTVLGEATATKKRQRLIVLRTQGQVKDQEVVLRNEVFSDIAVDLAARVFEIVTPGAKVTPGAGSTPAPTPRPSPSPEPTEREPPRG